MARRDGCNSSWRWQRAVTAGPHRTASRSQTAGPTADSFGRLFLYLGRPLAPLSCWEEFLPAPLVTAGLSRSGAQASTPGGGGVAVQDGTGEGASCRVRVSSTLSRPWNGRPPGPLPLARPVCPPGKRVIAKPPPLPAPRPLSGGCWRWCSAAWASRRARPPGAAGDSAAPLGRTDQGRRARPGLTAGSAGCRRKWLAVPWSHLVLWCGG